MRGSAEDQHRLGNKITALVPLRISQESTATRKRALLPPAPRLARKILAADALRKILRGALSHLVNSITLTIRADPDGVHQMRIAIRSARAALRLFGVQYGTATEHTFDSRLRSLGQVFGQERDWNVFCLDTLPGAIAAARSVSAATRLRRLRKPAEGLRRAAQFATIRAINGPLLNPLILQLAAWTDKRVLLSPSSRYDLEHQHLSVLAPLLLNRVARSAFKRTRHVDRLATDKLHRVRKAVRRLGSDATSLASAFPRRLVKPYKRRCDEVLRVLGAISDTVVTRRTANSLIMAHPDLRSGAAIVIRRAQRREAAERRTLKSALRALRRTPAFWL